MKTLLRILDGFDKRARVVEEWAAAIMILVIVFSIAMGVFWRYALRDPLSWPNELALFLFLWVVFLSASLVAREDGHFKIGFILDRRSELTQQRVNIFLNILKLFFLLTFIYASITVFPRQSMRRMTAVLGVHKGWHTFALTVGFTLIAVTVVRDTLRRIVTLRSGVSDQSGGDQK